MEVRLHARVAEFVRGMAKAKRVVETEGESDG